MEELVLSLLKHPFVKIHQKDDITMITTQHTVPTLVIFEKPKGKDWWWGRSLYERFPQGHIVDLASKNLELVKKIYSASPNLSSHLKCLDQWEQKFKDFVQVLIGTTNNVIIRQSSKVPSFYDYEICVPDSSSIMSIRNPTRSMNKVIDSLQEKKLCSIIKKTRTNLTQFIFKIKDVDLILSEISESLGISSSIWLKRNFLSKNEKVVMIQGVSRDFIELDIKTLPLQYQWSVLCHNTINNVPFVGLTGSVNNNNVQIPNQHNPSDQSFSVKQPLGWLTGYFDTNGSFVRIGKNISDMQKSLKFKFVAYGYKICSKKGLHLRQGIVTNHLSINQMVIVKLGFTKKTMFNLYSKNGKIRAHSATVVAMASLVPIDLSKMFVKLRMDVTESYSVYNKNFEYRLGKQVSVNDFSLYRYPTCGAGIHFFWNPIEAIQYKYPTLGSLRIKNIQKFAAICYNPKIKQYEFFPSTEDEAATMIQFFWRLHKSRKDWNSRLQDTNQTNPTDLNNIQSNQSDESKLRNIVRYWQEITWERINNKV